MSAGGNVEQQGGRGTTGSGAEGATLAVAVDRERIVAAAEFTVSHHTCVMCAAGRPCDSVMFAHGVLTLNGMIDSAVSGDTRVSEAHEAGRVEAVAQALAVLGRTEGQYRAEADGDTSHVSFALAEALRSTALVIRAEVRDPRSRTALEILARAEEAYELSQYVRGVSAQFRETKSDVAAALDDVAGDIAKGTEGVSRLQRATDISTPSEELADLAQDADKDVRWWVAQNPSTASSTLVDLVMAERHPMVLNAVLQNPHLPEQLVEVFADHNHPDVARTARRRIQRGTSD